MPRRIELADAPTPNKSPYSPLPFDLVWAKAGAHDPWWPAWIIDIFSYEHTFKGIPVPTPPDEIFEEGKWQPAGTYTVLYFDQNPKRRTW